MIPIYLEDVSKIPFTAPKVDMATNTGIVQAIIPKSRLAKVTATASEPKTSSGDSVV